jgi:phage tail sheath protein FI
MSTSIPGVYIEEINFPNQINAASTSLPVFIGYTEKITDTANKPVLFKPILIKSFIEYTNCFGNASTANTNFCLYESVQLYFDNGGKEIYIISCGDYSDGISLRPLLRGLNRSRIIDANLTSIPEAAFFADEIDFYKLQQKMLAVCAEKENRFAILDTRRPTNAMESDLDNYRAGIGNDNLKWGACYYPWIKTTGGKKIPPSGAVCGAYVHTDVTRGVWKAPANIALNNIADVTATINDAANDEMNVSEDGKSINSIRKFTGKGILIWGARTLMGNDNEWRYVPVKRFFMMVEQSISKATDTLVFEPNNSNTWTKVKAMIENFLILQWRNGALQGAKPEHAFYVQCGLGTTMTAQDILEGKMIIEVGMAMVRPAEFIIIRFSKKMIQ